MRLRPAAAIIAAALSVASGFDGVAAEPSASELAQALQRKYDAIRDFSADFVHTYRGGVLKKTLTERGTLLVKKPGKVRWEYREPEEKLFVSDGSKIYSYFPEDRQVIVSDLPSEEYATTPVLFLAGRGNLMRDFTPALVDMPAGMPPESRVLKLVPTVPQAEYDWLILAADPDTLALRGLVTGDAQGGTSTFTFTNLKENIRPSDTSFVFSPPRGVDVVIDPSQR